jgi:predicted RNase H-like HicB family nuclease
MAFYVALIRKDPDSDYGVEFPDFPGCVTATPVLEDVHHLAEEVLRFHVEGLLEDGEPLPEPSNAAEVLADPRNREALALLVELEELPGTSPIKVTRSV